MKRVMAAVSTVVVAVATTMVVSPSVEATPGADEEAEDAEELRELEDERREIAAEFDELDSEMGGAVELSQEVDEEIRESIARALSDPDRTDRDIYREAADDLRERLERIDAVIDEGDVDGARDEIAGADRQLRWVRDIVEAYREVDSSYDVLVGRLRDIRRESRLRRSSYVPHGEEIQELIDDADEHLEELDQLLESSSSPDELRSAEYRARQHVEELEERYEETASAYLGGVVGVPVVLMAVAGLVAAGLRRRRHRIEQECRDELDERLARWAGRDEEKASAVDDLRRRLEKLAGNDRAVGVDQLLEDDEIEAIDLVFVLQARVVETVAEVRHWASGCEDPVAGLERLEAYLDEKNLEFGAGDHDEATMLRAELEDRYRLSPHEVVDELDEALEEAGHIVDEAFRRLDEGDFEVDRDRRAGADEEEPKEDLRSVW